MPKNPTYTKPGTDVAPKMGYRLSRHYIDTWSTFMPAVPDAHRLFHALLCLTSRLQKDRMGPPTQPEEGYALRCVEIRELLGLRNSNCNRVIKNGCKELRESGHFVRLEMVRNNEWLRWRFEDSALQSCFDEEEYAVLDITMLRKLRSVTDYNVYAQVALCRRMRRPRFVTNLDDIGISVGNQSLTWAQHSRSFIGALKIACARYDLSALVYLGRHVARPGIGTVEVRLDYPGAAWSAQDLAKADPAVTRVIHVTGRGSEEVELPVVPEVLRSILRARSPVERPSLVQPADDRGRAGHQRR